MNAPIRTVPAAPEQQEAFRRAAQGTTTPALPLPGFTLEDIWGDYKPPRYLVKRLLGPSEITVLFGQSGHFKSVIAVDLALCVATGELFHGMRTRRGGVLYVAGEGHGGLKKRLRAWLLSHDMNAASERPALFVTSAGADLLGNPGQLRQTVDVAAAKLGTPIELMVIDTLAANFGQGDENNAGDMASAIASARQAAPAAAVLLVHHTGHATDSRQRERGSYALVAAADYRLLAAYDEASRLITVSSLKVKDDERPAPMTFSWQRVPLEWRDDEGEELSSVVLERTTVDAGTATAANMGKNQQTAFRVLQRLYGQRVRALREQGDHDEEAFILRGGWRAECEKVGLDRKRFAEALEGLAKNQCISVNGEQIKPLTARASE